jgi:hypothetical protein
MALASNAKMRATVYAAKLFASLPPPFATKGSRRALALLTIRKLSAQPRNHRHVDRVALGVPHAQVDHKAVV